MRTPVFADRTATSRLPAPASDASTETTHQNHRCKNVFYIFFYFGHVFTFFYFLKNVGKVQSGKQINKKHFQNNNNGIDL